MAVVYETDGGAGTLAERVEVADSLLAKARGLMFRQSPPEGALAFPFRRVARRRVHMLFVPFPVDAVWVADDRVTAVRRLPAWTGHGAARADLLLELPTGTASHLAPGDTVRLTDG